MAKKVVAIGSCEGVEEILSQKGYSVEHVEQKKILDILKKEEVEAVIVDVDDTVKSNVVISGIRHLYPGLWIAVILSSQDEKLISQVLKAGASNYIVKPVTEQNLIPGEEYQGFAEASILDAKSQLSPTTLDESKKIFPTRFYNAFFITEYGRLETLRAERYNKTFSVILTHIEGFHNLKRKLEKKELLDFLKGLIQTMMEVLRNCDVIGMVEDKKIVAVLPETDYFGSCISVRKLKKAIEQITTKGGPYASIIFSNVSYPRDGKGYGELLVAAENRVREQQDGVWVKSGLEDKTFWEIVSLLLEGKAEGVDTDMASFDMGEGFDFSISFLDRLQEMILQEILRDPRKKGFLYLGVRKISPNLPLLKAIEAVGATSTKIFVVGEGEEGRLGIQNAIPLYLADPRLLETFFIFLLREDFSYAAVCRESWGGQYSCFHTVDRYLIEGLVSKFQADYSLQEQL